MSVNHTTDEERNKRLVRHIMLHTTRGTKYFLLGVLLKDAKRSSYAHTVLRLRWLLLARLCGSFWPNRSFQELENFDGVSWGCLYKYIPGIIYSGGVSGTGLVFLFFFRPKFRSLKPKNTKTEKKCLAKKEKKTFVNGWVGANRTRVPKFRVYISKKRRQRRMLNKNWGGMLETVCIGKKTAGRKFSVSKTESLLW